MDEYINQIYNFLNSGQRPTTVMTVFIGISLVAVVLRMVVCSSLRGAQFAVRLNAKDIRAKADIAKVRYALLKNLAADYIRASEKNASRVPASALVDRQISGMRLFGWRFVNIMAFVEGIEGGMLIVGLIAAFVFSDYAFLYGSLGIAAFFVFRVIAALFDFRSACKILSDDLLIFTEREIGQFYASDAGSSLTRLRTELGEVISRQTVGLQDSLNKLAGAMSGAADKKLADINAALTASMTQWEQTIAKASVVQTGINEAAEKLKATIGGNNENTASQLAALTTATAAFTAEQEAFIAQAKFIERNQHILESTYQSYEMTLQNLTQTLGDGLGAYLKMHAQTASQAVNEAMSANIAKMMQAAEVKHHD